jgi:hypothetical protein
MFCFSWDNKQIKSKRFALSLIISRPNQIILLQFWKQADQIKMFCFRSNNKGTKSKPFASIYKFFYYIGTFRFATDNFWTKSNWFASSQNLCQNGNELLLLQKNSDQTKMFCFRSDLKRTKSKRFAFVPIISFDIGAFLLSFRYRWHY